MLALCSIAHGLSDAVLISAAIVVLLDVSGSMMLEAFPADEDTSVPPEGHVRIKCSSLLSRFVVELPVDSYVGDVRCFLTSLS